MCFSSNIKNQFSDQWPLFEIIMFKTKYVIKLIFTDNAICCS